MPLYREGAGCWVLCATTLKIHQHFLVRCSLPPERAAEQQRYFDSVAKAKSSLANLAKLEEMLLNDIYNAGGGRE